MEEFETEMIDDYRDLREALKSKAVQVIGTKEVLIAGLMALGAIGAAAFLPPLPIAEISGVGGLVTIGGLISMKSKFAEERRNLLREHPTAYLYAASGGIGW